MSTEQITKTAIITGGGSGMGLGVAKAYVQRGGNVVLNGRSEYVVEGGVTGVEVLSA